MADKKPGKSAKPKSISGSIKAPRKGGNPPFNPTPDQRKIVMMGKALGWTHPQIGRVLDSPERPGGVSADTVERHFKAEIDAGQDRANLAVAANLFTIATGQSKNAVTAAIFWLKCRAGWKPDDGPKQIEIEGRVARPGQRVPGHEGDGTEENPIKFTIKIGERPDADD